MGWWIGHSGGPWLSLAALPLSELVERALMRRAVPPDVSGAYVPLPVWGTLLVLGERSGFVLGRCLL